MAIVAHPHVAEPARRASARGPGPPASRPPGRPGATSVFDHAAGGANNLGTFAAYTTVALAPLALRRPSWAGVLLDGWPAPWARTGRGGSRRWAEWRLDQPARATGGSAPGTSRAPPSWWPPSSRRCCLVALVQFAKGGYLLAYLPAAVIALLSCPAGGRLNHRSSTGGAARSLRRRGLAVTSLAVVCHRRPRGPAVPGRRRRAARASPVGVGTRLWLEPAALSGPLSGYPGRRIRDGRRHRCRPAATSGRRSIPISTWWCSTPLDGGQNIYRNAGWALPGDRITLIQPGAAPLQRAAGRPVLHAAAKTVRGRTLGGGHPRRLPRPPRAGRADRPRGAALPVPTDTRTSVATGCWARRRSPAS